MLLGRSLREAADFLEILSISPKQRMYGICPSGILAQPALCSKEAAVRVLRCAKLVRQILAEAILSKCTMEHGTVSRLMNAELASSGEYLEKPA